MADSPSIPAFYLYGEPHRSVADTFVHVESLDDRTRPSEWTIRPHRHADLSHIFHVAAGGGAVRADGRELAFAAPCLLVIPAGLVHGFDWASESSGSVLTISRSHLAAICDRYGEFAALFRREGAVTLDPGAAGQAAILMATLARELAWDSPGHRAAVDAALLAIMTTVLRGLDPGAEARPASGGQAELVARLRQRIEERFRLREAVTEHAAALGVTVSRLRHACAVVARQSPQAMLDERALLEAKRVLLYSNLAVAEIAWSLGFEDAAYFSRFFTRHAGCPPRVFRQRSQGGNTGDNSG